MWRGATHQGQDDRGAVPGRTSAPSQGNKGPSASGSGGGGCRMNRGRVLKAVYDARAALADRHGFHAAPVVVLPVDPPQEKRSRCRFRPRTEGKAHCDECLGWYKRRYDLNRAMFQERSRNRARRELGIPPERWLV